MPSSSPTPPGYSQVPSILSSIGNRVLKAQKTTNDPLEPYLHAARWFPMSIHPFASLKRVLLAGISLDDMDEDDLEMEESFSEEEKSLHMMFLRSIPALKKTLTEFANHPDQLPQFIAVLSDAANKARQADTHNIKKAIPNYLLHDPSGKLDPPLTNSKDKAGRGFHHPQFARSLIPISRLHEYDADTEAFIAGIEEGRINLTLKDGFPTFLYQDAVDYDPDEKDKGLLRSRAILCVYRHIFTSESSAQDGKRGATKPSKAEIHGLTSATPRTLAYAVVQAMIALSSQSAWDIQDEYGYNYEELFDAILDLCAAGGLNPHSTPTRERLPFPSWNYRHRGRSRTSRRYRVDSDEEDEEPLQDHSRRRLRMLSSHSPSQQDHEVDEDNEPRKHNLHSQTRIANQRSPTPDAFNKPQGRHRHHQPHTPGGRSPTPQDWQEADEDGDHPPRYRNRVTNSRPRYRSHSHSAAPQ